MYTVLKSLRKDSNKCLDMHIYSKIKSGLLELTVKRVLEYSLVRNEFKTGFESRGGSNTTSNVFSQNMNIRIMIIMYIKIVYNCYSVETQNSRLQGHVGPLLATSVLLQKLMSKADVGRYLNHLSNSSC